MVSFGGLAIIGRRLRAVCGSMQRNEVCACGHFLTFGEGGHMAPDVYSNVLYISFRWHADNLGWRLVMKM